MQKQTLRSIAVSPFVAFVILCIGCAPTPTPTQAPPAVDMSVPPLLIPFAEAPTIDGTLAPTEWDAAHVEYFADGSELLLMRDTNYLYLTIRSTTDEMIAANIYTEENGQIIIRHSSAALGTGIYQANENVWLKTQDFEWQCRATDNSTASQAEREKFLKHENWLAANSRMGIPNELEYQIKITSDTMPLAISFMRSSEPDLRVYYPTDLTDDTTQPTPGGLPETRNFFPETWLFIDLTNQK